MKTRQLGSKGPAVSEIGLGCMTMSPVYGQTVDEAGAIATLERALELGVTFWDTADVYGLGHNEDLIGRVLKGRRQQVFLATKFGITRAGVNGSPDYVAQACDASLKRLGMETIDLYYLHRAEPGRPIEETVGAMAELVKQGKVRHLGLSEVSPETLERACKVHPIAAVQSEYSLWTRDPEAGILATCDRLGVGFVPYSPLGRGFLTGEIRSPDDFEEGDWRRSNPRFQGEAFARNLLLVDKVKALAAAKGVTPSQLALGWVMAKGPHIVPIPGTRRVKYLDDNVGAAAVSFAAHELAEIDAAFPADLDAGARYAPAMMAALNG
jgi:aryl-alcohol dehydrogenase-like predicted oxidoreductase